MGYKKEMEHLNYPFQNFKPLLTNRDLPMAQNEHLYAICCRQEADDDVISGKDVDTFQCSACANLRVAVSSVILVDES